MSQKSPRELEDLRKDEHVQSVIQGPRTCESAIAALQRYEVLNADLPRRTCRLLGLAAIGRYFGRRVLTEAFGTLPNTIFRDWSWRYWQALSLSGLDAHWEVFAHTAGNRSVRAAVRSLRKVCGEAPWALFLRRLGTNPYNAHRKRHNAPRRAIWTKGGIWRGDSNWTRILLLKQNIDRPYVRPFQISFGAERAKLLENELHHLINPDVELLYDARQHAVDYVKYRMKEMMLWRKVEAVKLAWFFQASVPNNKGIIVPQPDGSYLLRLQGKHRLWQW